MYNDVNDKRHDALETQTQPHEDWFALIKLEQTQKVHGRKH